MNLSGGVLAVAAVAAVVAMVVGFAAIPMGVCFGVMAIHDAYGMAAAVAVSVAGFILLVFVWGVFQDTGDTPFHGGM